MCKGRRLSSGAETNCTASCSQSTASGQNSELTWPIRPHSRCSTPVASRYMCCSQGPSRARAWFVYLSAADDDDIMTVELTGRFGRGCRPGCGPMHEVHFRNGPRTWAFTTGSLRLSEYGCWRSRIGLRGGGNSRTVCPGQDPALTCILLSVRCQSRHIFIPSPGRI